MWLQTNFQEHVLNVIWISGDHVCAWVHIWGRENRINVKSNAVSSVCACLQSMCVRLSRSVCKQINVVSCAVSLCVYLHARDREQGACWQQCECNTLTNTPLNAVSLHPPRLRGQRGQVTAFLSYMCALGDMRATEDNSLSFCLFLNHNHKLWNNQQKHRRRKNKWHTYWTIDERKNLCFESQNETACRSQIDIIDLFGY